MAVSPDLAHQLQLVCFGLQWLPHLWRGSRGGCFWFGAEAAASLFWFWRDGDGCGGGELFWLNSSNSSGSFASRCGKEEILFQQERVLPSALAHSVRSSPRSIQRPNLWLIPRLCSHLGWEPLAARSNSAARPATAIDEVADEEIRSNGNWYFCMLLLLLLSRGSLPSFNSQENI